MTETPSNDRRHDQPPSDDRTWSERCLLASPHRQDDTERVTYDGDLADRLRFLLAEEPGLTERPMFGGLAFMIDGHMAVSASGHGGLLLRVDPADTATLLNPPSVRRFEMRGRPMDGWLRVDAEAVESDDDLRRWVGVGVACARSLPPK